MTGESIGTMLHFCRTPSAKSRISNLDKSGVDLIGKPQLG